MRTSFWLSLFFLATGLPRAGATAIEYQVEWPGIYLTGRFTLQLSAPLGNYSSTQALGTYEGVTRFPQQTWTNIQFRVQSQFAEVTFHWPQGFTGYAVTPAYVGRATAWTNAAEAWADLRRKGLTEGVNILPIPVPPGVTCPESRTLECNGGVTSLSAHVEDVQGNPLEVIWTVDGVPWQTNLISSGGPTTSADVTLTASFSLGLHLIGVSVSNGLTSPAVCSSMIEIQDTTPPSIDLASADPAVLWPPNNQMRLVRLDVRSSDLCGSVTNRILFVTANEPIATTDWRLLDNSSLELRAKRFGNGRNRVYTILVECTDDAGNTSTRAVSVTVPHDQRSNLLRGDLRP